MITGRYRARGAVVDAMRWDGASEDEARVFAGSDPADPHDVDGPPVWVTVSRRGDLLVACDDDQVRVSEGEWLLRDEDGRLSKCPSGVFAATFTRVRDRKV